MLVPTKYTYIKDTFTEKQFTNITQSCFSGKFISFKDFFMFELKLDKGELFLIFCKIIEYLNGHYVGSSSNAVLLNQESWEKNWSIKQHNCFQSNVS